MGWRQKDQLDMRTDRSYLSRLCSQAVVDEKVRRWSMGTATRLFGWPAQRIEREGERISAGDAGGGDYEWSSEVSK